MPISIANAMEDGARCFPEYFTPHPIMLMPNNIILDHGDQVSCRIVDMERESNEIRTSCSRVLLGSFMSLLAAMANIKMSFDFMLISVGEYILEITMIPIGIRNDLLSSLMGRNTS